MEKLNFRCAERMSLLRELSEACKPSPKLRDTWLAEQIDLRTDEGWERAAELSKADLGPRMQDLNRKIEKHHALTGHWIYGLRRSRPRFRLGT